MMRERWHQIVFQKFHLRDVRVSIAFAVLFVEVNPDNYGMVKRRQIGLPQHAFGRQWTCRVCERIASIFNLSSPTRSIWAVYRGGEGEQARGSARRYSACRGRW